MKLSTLTFKMVLFQGLDLLVKAYFLFAKVIWKVITFINSKGVTLILQRNKLKENSS